jgi:hypothetical protein
MPSGKRRTLGGGSTGGHVAVPRHALENSRNLATVHLRFSSG